MLDVNTVICASCNRRIYKKHCPITKGYLGVCKECMKGFKFTQKGGSFEGSRYVSYVLSPLMYEDSAKEMIGSLKFSYNTAVADIFGDVLADFLSQYEHLSEFDEIAVVPLSKQRMNERGYNQAMLIAEFVSECIKVPIADVLVRTKHTKRQASLNARERFYNVKDAFWADESVKDKRIILVDDVRTTGHTMENCAKALVEKGALEVIGITATISVYKPKNHFA